MTNVANPIAQAFGMEGQRVDTFSLIVSIGLDGQSTASAVLAVCWANINMATVPTSHSCSRAVSVMTSAGPCGPIMTVVRTSGYVIGYPVKKTGNKSKVDQAVGNKITAVFSDSNTDQIKEKIKTREEVKIYSKLKLYAGGPGVEQYSAQFKMVAKLNGWPDDEWGIILATFLDDKAKRLLS